MSNEDRSFKGTYDLCIEFLSDSTRKEIERDTIEKKAEYEAAGVREYFILDRLGLYTAFYRLSEQGYFQAIQPISAGNSGTPDVIQSQVLEQFAFCLQDLDSMPPFEKLIDLPMYYPFVMKSLQQKQVEIEQALQREKQERSEKEQALQREKQERNEKEQALQREKQLRALLHKAGIDLTNET